ncbi:MAG: MerR family transcriptional regulator [Pelagibacteraceae bacterium]|jgi:DNA-binding transcriptional MerR regulator|nr:MerR family transcriptional regulator [Pelagibacteraceae bacterium]
MLDSKKELLTISEVVELFNLQKTKVNKISTHTLRFWEGKFKQLKPTILSGSRRYYSKKNIEVLKLIIFLLKDRRLTIKGAIKVMNEKPKDLDVSKLSSIKAEYYIKNIKLRSKKILDKIKKING